MANTPILSLAEWAAAQSTPWIAHNIALRWLEFFSAGGGVADRGLATPPGSPSDGDAYLVAGSATGSWAGQEGDIALYISSGWVFKSPVEGMALYVNDEDVRIEYDGSSWGTLGGGGGATEATASEILIGSETGKYVSPDKFRTATAPATLTDAATIAVDFEAGRNFTVTLGGNRTLGNPTNVQAGDSGTIYVIQDGTGSRTLAFASNWKHIGAAPTISGTANVVNVFSYFARSATAISLTYLGVEV